MSESTSKSVECPLCGETFDPTAAGGWCTNSECGEWQYDGEIETADEEEAGTPADGESTDEESTDDVSDSPLFGGDDSDDAETAEEPALDLDEPGEDADESEDDADVADADAAVEEADAEPEPEPELDESHEDEPEDDAEEADADAAAEAADTEPEPEPELGEADTDETDEDDADTLDACPECATAVDPSDAFCPGCGEDLDAHRGSDEKDDDTLDACPECGTDVGPDDAFCAGCGEDLDAHRGGDDEDALDACPSCGDDVEPSDAFCASCGEDLDAHRAGEVDDATTGGAPTTEAPSALALSAYGHSVIVEDEETVGRQIRSLLADAGKNEDQAVRIHREHVRFVRDGGQFYVVDLGENPTEVNGARMSKGDREPIGPGDELNLSDVVTLDVEAP